MFQVDLAANRLSRLEPRRFTDLNLREREHLQEWLANMPDALGEDLLIIQKEFDGFADTRERLDLLALDKNGQLVVIENKLDDSGRDVTWQALKYTAYCSSFTKAQIVDIYQQYLGRYCGGGNAADQICEFLNAEELTDVVLNPGNTQRIMLIAANFRKEVTATILWLLEHNIRAQCFKVVPYSFDQTLLIDVQQIIPPPEAAEFMISMSSKESEEKTEQVALNNRQKLRLAFWEQCLQTLHDRSVDLFKNINPSKDHWISAGSGIRSCPYTLIFAKREARVQLEFTRSDVAENDEIFQELQQRRSEVETRFGAELEWLSLPGKKSSRIQFAKPFDGFNQECWPDMIDWIATHIVKLESAFGPSLSDLNPSNRKTGEGAM